MTPETTYEFDKYQLDAGRRLLSHRDAGPITITGRVFETLLYLIENRGRVVEKRELMTAVWGNAVVEENNLTQTISALRRLLGERPDEHRFIVTEPGRGYRFIAQVTASAAVQPLPPEMPQRSAPTPARRRFRSLPLLGAGLLFLALLAWFAWQGLRKSVTAPSTSASSIRAIAVLPFKPLVADGRDFALELGMADTLIARLSNSGSLVVRPLSSVRRYGSLDQDPLAAGRTLGVDAVLDGSIQRAGNAIRVTARLIRIHDGASIWGDKFDQTSRDVFAVQDAIAEQVVSALALRLTTAERQRLNHRYTESEPAYRLYLLGRYHWGRLTPPEIRKGIDYFHQAIDLDPTYALAYAGLAESYRSLPITSDVPPSQVLPMGKAAAQQALEIDAQLDAAQATLCFIQIWSDWDWTSAERSCKRALEINPNGADGHRAYAVLLSDLARHEQAIAEARRARELDPLSLLTNVIEAHVLHYAGRNADAMRRLQATFELDDFWIAHLIAGKVLVAEARLDEALREFAKARDLSARNSEAISLLGYALARKGDRAGANRALGELLTRARSGYLPPFNIAMIYNGLGDRQQTFAWLEKAYADRDVRLTFLKVEHKWDTVRSDPRFVSLARRMKLE